MADLSTKYLGLDLRNPIIAASSGLTNSVKEIVELDKNGVGAVVLKSIFEEQIHLEADHNIKKMQADGFAYDEYSETMDYIDVHIKEKELSNTVQDIDHLKKGLLSKVQVFEKQLQNSVFEKRVAVESALLEGEKEKAYKKIKKQLEERELQLKTLKLRAEQASKRLLENKSFFLSKEEILSKEEKRKLQAKETTERIGEIRSKFELNKQIKDRNKEVFNRIEKQEKEWKKWKELMGLLGGSKDAFNTYVQRLTLQNLIHRANLHLSHLNPRYSLQMRSQYKAGEELNFHLIDHYQMDQSRLVETSSGGEKFLISLALALGLSDIASKNVNVESLFIDEGFGTLDQATLEIVISTLESLQSQGKRIGIISHVETLKNRISTQIQVNRKGNGVSEVLVV